MNENISTRTQTKTGNTTEEQIKTRIKMTLHDKQIQDAPGACVFGGRVNTSKRKTKNQKQRRENKSEKKYLCGRDAG